MTADSVRRIPLSFLLLATITSYGFSQQAGQSVRGVVRDTAGAPLGGVDVFLGPRQTTTNAQGLFRVDSLRPGQYVIMIRLVGYSPIRSRVTVAATGPTALEYVLVPAPVMLPNIVVEGHRTGIYGTVGDPSLHAAVGARVQVLGAQGGEALTDSLGRFAFPNADRGAYLVRVTFPGYYERRMTLELVHGEGRELAVVLSPGSRPASRADESAYQDLRLRLATSFRRERLTAAGLAPFGSVDLCNVPMRMDGMRGPPVIVVNGVDVYRGMPQRFLCFWRADEIELVEFGADVCRESSGTVAYLLNVWCSGGTRRAMGGGRRVGAQEFGGGYVIIWEKR